MDELRISVESLQETLATKADVASLRAEIDKMNASIRTWMLATMIGLFLGFSGLFFAILSVPAAPATTSSTGPFP